MNTYKLMLVFGLIPEKIPKLNHGLIVLDISLPQNEARSRQKPEQSKVSSATSYRTRCLTDCQVLRDLESSEPGQDC